MRVIDYQPKGQDTLSRLVRGELKPVELQAISQPETRLSSPDKAPLPPSPIPQTPATAVGESPQDEPSLEVKKVAPDSTEVTEIRPELPSPSDLEPEPVVENPTEATRADSPQPVPMLGTPQDKGEALPELSPPTEASVIIPENNPDATADSSVFLTTKLSGN